MESFKRGSKYRGKLAEYGARAFVSYFEKVFQALTEKGVEATMLVVAELKEALMPSKLTL